MPQQHYRTDCYPVARRHRPRNRRSHLHKLVRRYETIHFLQDQDLVASLHHGRTRRPYPRVDLLRRSF